MDYDELKIRIQKNIKEDIAISNIKEEISMNKIKNRKKLYTILSSCAVIFICSMIVIHSNILKLEKDGDEIGSIQEIKEENIKIHINKIKKQGAMKLDADIQTRNLEDSCMKAPYDIPFDKFKIPKDINGVDLSAVYIKENDSKEYNVLNNYINYYHDSDGNDRNITIAFSNSHKPLRDYYFGEDNGKTSTIADVEMTIYQYEKLYMTAFTCNDINFDIETENITEKELVTLLKSIVISLQEKKIM